MIRAEEERRIMMLNVPNTEGSTMMITNSMNPSDAMNVAKMVKNERKNSLKMTSFVITARKQVIQRRNAETPWKTTKDGAK